MAFGKSMQNMTTVVGLGIFLSLKATGTFADSEIPRVTVLKTFVCDFGSGTETVAIDIHPVNFASAGQPPKWGRTLSIKVSANQNKLDGAAIYVEGARLAFATQSQASSISPVTMSLYEFDTSSGRGRKSVFPLFSGASKIDRTVEATCSVSGTR